ncbi:MAG: DUF6062 family protein [Acetanaerobacterium sp.]
MKETIFTIPVSEVFEPRDGCPLCRMHDTLEERAIDAILGAAMMEPDIRIQTNKLGFCTAHFDKMLMRNNRLSLALMLESHLNAVQGILPGEREEKAGKADVRKAQMLLQSCYVCEKIDLSMDRMIENLFSMYGKEESFRTLYAEQPFVCLAHYVALAQCAPKALGKKELGGFLSVTGGLARAGLAQTHSDVDAFCQMFDYRNAGKAASSPRIKTAVEHAIQYLTGHKPG